MIRRNARIVSLALGLSLTACTASSDYPSLSIRQAERISGSASVVTAQPGPPALPAPNPEFASRLAQLVDQARGAHQRFSNRRGNAEQRVSTASGAAVASEAWSVANVALADLEASRSEAMVALGELDAIYAAEAIAATESGNPSKRDAAATARDQVTAIVGEEDDVLARLRARLRS